MGRKPCCSKDASMNRGAWTPMEDKLLDEFIKTHGEGKWRSLPERAGLKRCGKSCRLRWMNYLRPDIKRGSITEQEEDLIVRLHKLLGNRWSLIAGRLPGRTDNEIKNYWHTKLVKKIKSHSEPTHDQSLTKRKLTKKQNLYAPQPRRHGGVKPSAVQPKAGRCTKQVVMIPSHAESEGDKKPYERFDQSSSTSRPTTTAVIETSPINVEGNEQFDDFMIDFEMDHHLLSDFLNTDLFEPSDSEKYGGDYQSSSEGNIYDTDHISSPSKSDETFLFLSEETPPLVSVFGSVEFPTEIDQLDNWLQVN